MTEQLPNRKEGAGTVILFGLWRFCAVFVSTDQKNKKRRDVCSLSNNNRYGLKLREKSATKCVAIDTERESNQSK
jgi:hypothetical protein